jgi:hypothetical protein
LPVQIDWAFVGRKAPYRIICLSGQRVAFGSGARSQLGRKRRTEAVRLVSLVAALSLRFLDPCVSAAQFNGSDMESGRVVATGLSLVHVRGIAAGPGFVFTYGPLGFLEYPNIVWLPGAILGLVYVVATTFAFYYLVCRRLLEWLPPLVALALTAALALVTAQVFSVAEVATAALILGADVGRPRRR